jgi:hypothetical protein
MTSLQSVNLKMTASKSTLNKVDHAIWDYLLPLAELAFHIYLSIVGFLLRFGRNGDVAASKSQLAQLVL